jgi:hypothetical protein
MLGAEVRSRRCKDRASVGFVAARFRIHTQHVGDPRREGGMVEVIAGETVEVVMTRLDD